MPPITLPHTFRDGVGEQASGAQVMDNFNALRTPLEAAQSQLAAVEGTRWLLNGTAQSSPLEVRSLASLPTAGPNPLFTYTEYGIAFATACLAAFVGGWVVYSDPGHTSPVIANFNAAVSPNGKNVDVSFQAGGGITLYPRIYIGALGH
jgi:hypothetical protein